MALPLPANEIETLTRSFSGIGVDEKSVISTLGKWRPEHRHSFPKSCSEIFKPGGGHHHTFKSWDGDHFWRLKTEFSRFKKAVMLWTMDPCERDARWAHHVITKIQPSIILIEIACTRSSEELLGLRRAYHSLFHHSVEEDVASHAKKEDSNLLVALVSAYRYEGPHVHEELAKSEAKILGDAIRNGGHDHSKKPIMENYEVIRILATRSKSQIRTTFKHYKEIYGNSIQEDLGSDASLRETVQCLDSPPSYFSKVIELALTDGAGAQAKEALTRVLVTRADVDMKEIKEEYHRLYGVSVEERIEEATLGNYKDFLLTLVGRGAN